MLGLLVGLGHPARAELGLAGVAAAIAAKNAVMVGAVVLLSTAFGIDGLLDALRRLGLPAPLVSTLGFMERYLQVLADERDRMLLARRARSARTGPRGWADRAGLLEPPFVRALERGERIEAALLARGWDGRDLPPPTARGGVAHERYILDCRAGTRSDFPLCRRACGPARVDLAVAAGECVALIGPNGAGKSTFLWHLNGLLPGRRGRQTVHAHGTGDIGGNAGTMGGPSIWIDGVPVISANFKEIRRRVGLLFQDRTTSSSARPCWMMLRLVRGTRACRRGSGRASRRDCLCAGRPGRGGRPGAASSEFR